MSLHFKQDTITPNMVLTLCCTWDLLCGLLTAKSEIFLCFYHLNSKSTYYFFIIKEYKLLVGLEHKIYIIHTNSQCPRTVCPFMSLTSDSGKIPRALHQLFHVCLWRREKNSRDHLVATSVTYTCRKLLKIHAFQELACVYRSWCTWKSGIK